jgi:hypothetical protein
MDPPGCLRVTGAELGYDSDLEFIQALEGQTPTAFGKGEKLADVIDLEAVRRKRLVRRSFAHGLLNSYELVDGEDAGTEGERQAAA